MNKSITVTCLSATLLSAIAIGSIPCFKVTSRAEELPAGEAPIEIVD